MAAAVVALVVATLAGCGPAVTWQAPPTRTGPATINADPQPRTITIVGGGDILLHPPLWQQARADAGGNGFDFVPILAGAREVISSADLAICHVETPLAPASGPFAGYPRFSVPPQIASALAEVGFDSCSTASNHTIDQGTEGVVRTLDALDAAGIRHAGSYRTMAEHDTVTLLDVQGVAVVHLSYTYGFNGLRRPTGKEWISNQIDVPTILAEAKQARAEGAEIVVVSLHFGTEYAHTPNAQQVSVARQLLASPEVDLILGHHAHVVQPFEKVGDKWVAYGLGNQIAHHAQPQAANREGVIARFTFTEVSTGTWRVIRAEAIPTWMRLSPDRLTVLSDALGNRSAPPRDAATLRAAWERIKGHVFSRGADDDGLVVAGW